jgi:hypothetical protein
MLKELWWIYVNEYTFKDLGLDEKIILKQVFKKCSGKI